MFTQISIKIKLLIILVVITMGIIMLSFLLMANTTGRKTFTTVPTNYPLNPSDFKNYTISSVFPIPDSTDATVVSSIGITFSRPLTELEQKSVEINIQPKLNGTYSWTTGNRTILFTPIQQLPNNQSFTVTLSSQVKKTWRFTTTSLPLDQDLQNYQAQTDKRVADEQKAIDTAYPWLDKLPLQVPTYFVYFNPQEKMFVAKLYPKTNSDDEVQNIKSTIIRELTNRQIPVTNFPITWTIIRP